MIERKIVRRRFLHAARHEQNLTALLRIARRVADHAEPAFAMPPPVEDLAAAERQGEIKLGRGDGGQAARHWRGHWMK